MRLPKEDLEKNIATALKMGSYDMEKDGDSDD